MDKVKQTQRRWRETNLKENGFWLSFLQFRYVYGDDPVTILNYLDLVERLMAETVQRVAQRYLNMEIYGKVVLYPEEAD